MPVAEALLRFTSVRLLVCADDDYLGRRQPGIRQGQRSGRRTGRGGPIVCARPCWQKSLTSTTCTRLKGLHQVRSQIEARLRQLGWGKWQNPPPHRSKTGVGDSGSWSTSKASKSCTGGFAGV